VARNPPETPLIEAEHGRTMVKISSDFKLAGWAEPH
jgi:hypothetical protein